MSRAYHLEIIDTDGTKLDLSDASWVKIRETMTLEEYHRRVLFGIAPDFIPYNLTQDYGKLKRPRKDL